MYWIYGSSLQDIRPHFQIVPDAAKTAPVTGYFNRKVLSSFWTLDNPITGHHIVNKGSCTMHYF